MINVGRFKIHWAWLICGIILIMRAISLGLYPLMDTTEARYGEMSRIMVETGNWLTPQLDYNIPFWGKPPLQNWMSATGIKIFGNNEFAIRFPHFIAGLLILWLIWKLSYAMTENRKLARKAVLILATTLAFIISSGVVMTDTALTLGVTLALYAFYQRIHYPDKDLFSHLFFLGIAIGLLAKGPLTLVLIFLTVVPWAILEWGFVKGIRQLFTSFRWISGLVILSILAFSWYFMAERATPGFLKYFIIDEHISRFLVPGWKGDLYGAAHARPKGTIWLFWLVFALPWSPILIRDLIKYKNVLWINTRKSRSWFLFFWMISPLLLFTAASNILIAYVLPGIPAAALLMSELSLYHSKKFLIGVSSTSIIILGVIFYVLTTPKISDRSDKVLLSMRSQLNIPVYYLNNTTYSGKYYTQGKAKKTTHFLHNKPFYMMIPLAQAYLGSQNHCQIIDKNLKRELLYCD